VALPVRARHCSGRRRQFARTAISDWQTRIHKVGPIPDARDSTASAQLAPPRKAQVECSTARRTENRYSLVYLNGLTGK
jgi:hypothetical protein